MEAALREKKNALTKVEPVDPDLASISAAATRAKPLPCTMFACIRTTVAFAILTFTLFLSSPFVLSKAKVLKKTSSGEEVKVRQRRAYRATAYKSN